MTHILVTGAAGFIGSHLCETLLDRGHTVRGVDAFTTFYDPARKRDNLRGLLRSTGFELAATDLASASPRTLRRLLDGVEAVVHLAGEPGVTHSWGESFGRYVERNVLATQRLLEALPAHGVRRFVHASSSSVYGSGGKVLRATGEPRPASPYGVTKLAGETLVGAYAAERDLPAAILRYFSVYGPRQRPDMAAHRFVEALLDGRPPTVYGDGRQVRDFTYVGDVVAATVAALDADLPQGAVLDVASAHPVSVAAMLHALECLVDVDQVVQRAGARPGDVSRTAGDITAARRWLGWEPEVDLAAGLARQVAWHRSLRAGDAVPAAVAASALGG
jgi:nucleoside-diphosphate-sugar epimerase